MHISPADPFLPDGTIMRGNMIERNIFYYPNQPESKYIRQNGVNLQYNTIDYNIVWSGGKKPIKTGEQGYMGTLAELTKKIPNADFSRRLTPAQTARHGSNTIAAGWQWYQKIYPDLKAEITKVNGKNALRIPGRFNATKKYIKDTCIRSSSFDLEKGKSYRLTFKMRHKDATGGLLARFVTEGKGYCYFNQRVFEILGIGGVQLHHGHSSVKAFMDFMLSKTGIGPDQSPFVLVDSIADFTTKTKALLSDMGELADRMRAARAMRYLYTFDHIVRRVAFGEATIFDEFLKVRGGVK